MTLDQTTSARERDIDAAVRHFAPIEVRRRIFDGCRCLGCRYDLINIRAAVWRALQSKMSAQ